MKFSKKKIFVTIPIALISLELYFGVLFGYLVGKVLSGKETGQKGLLQFNVFHFGRWKLHFHHWFYGLGILVSVFWYQFLPFPQFSFGFLGGFIWQGIYCYSDWYKIFSRRK